MSSNTDSDAETLRGAVERAAGFVYGNALPLVGLSLAWSVASAPLVTIGPATLGAYAAIDSLRETGRIDRRAVATAVRRGGVHAAALSALPALLGAISLVYALEFAATGGTLVGVLAVAAAYAAVYAVLVLIPAFVSLSRGESPTAALRTGWTWTAAHPTLTLTTGLFTLCLLVGTAVLTVAFVACFPALAFSLHVELFSSPASADEEQSTAQPRRTTRRSRSTNVHERPTVRTEHERKDSANRT
ncbi:hypothetical protein [Halegenticoccus soli]|uniref:hypothetical protein n=1 Tax=Halegenticoccus soli TaxID=1985678 RepID=UPI00117B3B46|nr:hypothetical protein [Halegenticoccus soli]